MKKELELELVKKYPKLFKGYGGDPRKTCLSWGCECGDGWYNLIDHACFLIQNHIDNQRKYRATTLQFNRALKRWLDKGDDKGLYHFYNYYKNPDHTKNQVDQDKERGKYRDEPDPVYQVEFLQVKEKFGTLNMYCAGADQFAYGVLAMAESLSANTCEFCGQPGKIRKGGWLKCRCDACQEEKESDC